jgi:hypothetical protein
METHSPAPIFIVGCPRSGTSMLRDLLRSHPRLTFPGESHFIPAFYRGYGDPRDSAEARKLAAAILELRWVRAWNLRLEADSFTDCRSFREVLCRLYEAWARQQNKPHWGDKTPDYVTEIPLLAKLFPEARIIHIYRDGRDVALSWIQARFTPQNMYTAARLWKSWVSAGRRAGAALPREMYLELRYEQLLAQPRETMQRVCEFVGEPFDEAVLRLTPIRPKRRFFPRFNPFAQKQPRPVEIVSSNCGKWKTRMPARDRVLFESVAGDLLRTLGYETEGRTRRIGGAERLAWGLHQHFWRVAVRILALRFDACFATFRRLTWAKARSRFRTAPP